MNTESLSDAMKAAYATMRAANPTGFIHITATISGHTFNEDPDVGCRAAYVCDDKSQPDGFGAIPAEAAEMAIKAWRSSSPQAELEAQAAKLGMKLVPA